MHVGAASAMDLDDEVAGLRGKVKMLKQCRIKSVKKRPFAGR